MELAKQDSKAFEDLLAFLQSHPEIKKYELINEPMISLPNLEIHLSKRKVFRGQQEIPLTKTCRLYTSSIVLVQSLWSLKYKQETLIKAKNLHITVTKEPNAQTQSWWTCEKPHRSSAPICLSIYFAYIWLLSVSFRFLSILFRLLCRGIAINTVMIAESTSAIGCAYKIPFSPHTLGRVRITGIKHIPCLQAPSINPSIPLPKARNNEE